MIAEAFFPNGNDLNYVNVYEQGVGGTWFPQLKSVFLHELGHVNMLLLILCFLSSNAHRCLACAMNLLWTQGRCMRAAACNLDHVIHTA